jgi:transposase-like protein
VPKPYPREFRDDVVRVARDREPGVTVEQVAKDFGVHPMTLFKWLRQADVDDDVKPGVSRGDAAELREARNGSSCWSRRTRSCAVRRRICRRRICREMALPAREMTLPARERGRRRRCSRRGDVPGLDHRSTVLIRVACPPGHRPRTGRGVSGGRVVQRPPR